nr:ribonuclease H-like domain-containing protein [Tanacetum cinerariifolium]
MTLSIYVVVSQAKSLQLKLQRPRQDIMDTLNGLKTWYLAQCGVKYRLAMQTCSLRNLALGRKHQQSYGFAVNRESARDVYFKRRIIIVAELQIVEWHNYKHWIGSLYVEMMINSTNSKKEISKGFALKTCCFFDCYEVPKNDAATGSASEGTATKKGRTVAVTTKDMQKRRNDVKARTTLLLALPDEHQLRFSKYKTTQKLWAAILKTFGWNEATKKTKKNLLKQQYGNFKAEGSETLKQTFNRLQVIVSQLEFMDIEIEQDDPNQKFLTSLALEWLMHTIMWRNRSDLDIISLDDLYNHLKVYEPKVQKKPESNSQNMAFISTAKNSSGNGEVNTTNIPIASTQVSPAISNVAIASISLDTASAYIAS